jgi:hypothetical protein
MHRMSRHWSEFSTNLARKMLARGDGPEAFQKQFGRSKKAAENRVRRVSKISPDRPRSPPKNRKTCVVTVAEGRVTIPDHVLADARARAAAYRSPIAELLGEPAFCQSALAKKMSGVSA